MKLNKAQELAVTYKKGPLMIIAGAGTGKTTVVTQRIRWLISKQGLDPDNILALTFTEKAAREMEERVDQILPLGYSQLWVSTFHSFCDRILKDELSQIGLNPNYQLMSTAETILFLRQHLFDFDFDYFRPNTNPDKFLGGIIDHFSRLADEDITCEQYHQYFKKIDKKTKSKEEALEIKKIKELSQAFIKYQQLKEKNSLFDFSDLISYTLKLFRLRPNILANYRKKFRFILVDEFQDTNVAQYELVKLLAPPKENPNLTVTGDDSQSIYKFRGAAVSNILNFKEDYHQSKLVVLTKNYRSTQEILDRSYQLIKHNDPDTLENKLGISKNLDSARKVTGETIKVFFNTRVEQEAETVVAEIKKLTAKDYQFKDIAILFRANNHAEPFIQTLTRSGIPYQFLGPSYLFRKPEIKTLIAYLQLLVDIEDDLAFFKVASEPVFEISARQLAKIRSTAKKENYSFFEVAEKEPKESASFKFTQMVNRHLKLLNKETGGQVLYYFLEDSGQIKQLLNPNNQQAQEQATNIAKFFNRIKVFESQKEDANIFNLLSWISLRMELGESPTVSDTDWEEENRVNLVTVHSSKGLEFPIVFMINLVNLRFPSINRREQIPIPQPLIKEILPEGNPHDQEERRLFYVAMTRAKDLLYFTGAKFYEESSKREKKLSPFIFEALGEKEINIMDKNNNDHQMSLLSWQKNKQPKIKKKIITVNYLSHSQINTFNTCPLQYKYQYRLKLPTRPSSAQTTGTIIHRTLREFYQEQILAKEALSQKELFKILDQNWVTTGFKSKKHQQESKETAEKILKNYYQKEIKDKIFPKVAALEQTFSFRITPQLKIGGIIDRVDLLEDNQIEIIDYKTGSRLPSQKEVDQDQQIGLYALATSTINQLAFHRPLDKIILSFYYLTPGVKIATKRSQQQITQLRKEIINTAKKIEQSNFTPTPGIPFPCNYCLYKILCQAWN